MAFKSKVSSSIGLIGSPTTVTDTVVASTSHVVIGLQIANVTDDNITVSAKLVKNGGASAFIVRNAAVLPGGSLVIVGGDQKLALEEGDSVTAYSSVATSADVIISYLV